MRFMEGTDRERWEVTVKNGGVFFLLLSIRPAHDPVPTQNLSANSLVKYNIVSYNITSAITPEIKRIR